MALRRQPILSNNGNYLPPEYELTEEEKKKIREHNESLNFTWNAEAGRFVSETDRIRETPIFISVNGKRYQKTSVLRKKYKSRNE